MHLYAAGFTPLLNQFAAIIALDIFHKLTMAFPLVIWNIFAFSCKCTGPQCFAVMTTFYLFPEFPHGLIIA
jgi:hypothetical protein